ncbi:hypothetical protein CLUG_05698 [Clavispora lusitaniae ATCC 42720]|uniref:Uncharacterized protein n=1 Tax=Clavispora lusitaniae (strain ATCC 42720) TaxID=306902 RepID=C4YBX0_CLAL4|nr:uncharacterized protein CLUG_05698 [Clavispora lusitaniae ATCC 42720]EEQ41568.1 hypothetical protein CLUG_05698 [Clavispora lusitaniae ATCC 42720]
MHLVVLHAIVSASKTGTTSRKRTHVLAFARVCSVVPGQMAQRGEGPPTRFARMFSFGHHGLGFAVDHWGAAQLGRGGRRGDLGRARKRRQNRLGPCGKVVCGEAVERRKGMAGARGAYAGVQAGAGQTRRRQCRVGPVRSGQRSQRSHRRRIGMGKVEWARDGARRRERKLKRDVRRMVRGCMSVGNGQHQLAEWR